MAEDARPINNKVAKSLRKYFEVYVPHEQDENNPMDGVFDGDAIFKIDFAAMRRADLCVVVGKFGKDCSWEIGWFAGQEIPIYFVPNGDASYRTSPMLVPYLHNQVGQASKAGAYIHKHYRNHHENKSN